MPLGEVTLTTHTDAPPPRPDPQLHFHVIYVQYRYSLFLAACQLFSGKTFCENYVLNGQPVLEGPLTKNISTVDCNQVKCAVSLVHDCTDGCKFEERDSSRRIEWKLTNE